MKQIEDNKTLIMKNSKSKKRIETLADPDDASRATKMAPANG
jgi:hypothetical protein